MRTSQRIGIAFALSLWLPSLSAQRNPLPWDQRAYWATTVTINIARSSPLVGEYVAGVMRGGANLGALTLLMAVLVGRWALVPTFLFFVVLGNTSSGGAVSPPLLPQPFAFLSNWLPSGSTVTAVRLARKHVDVVADGGVIHAATVVVATGTASGKSLCFHVPIAEAVTDPIRPGSALLDSGNSGSATTKPSDARS